MAKPDELFTGTRSDEEVVSRFGMTLDEVESEAKQVEDENVDDGLTEVFYYGSPLDRLKDDEPMRNISVRFSVSEINAIGELAKKFHVSRSEYIRRKVLG